MYNLIFLVEVEYSNMTNASVVFFPQVLEAAVLHFLRDYWTLRITGFFYKED